MRAPVRVGLVTTSYPRFDGDPAGCFVAEHARYLESQGHTVEVVAAGDRGDGIRVPGGALFYSGGGPEALERGGAWGDAALFTARITREVARRGAGPCSPSLTPATSTRCAASARWVRSRRSLPRARACASRSSRARSAI